MAEIFKRIIRVPSHRQVSRTDLKGKTVVLRCDFNVPVENGVVADVKRISSAIPTIEKILEKGASKISILTHFGRPEGKYNKEFSTEIIARTLASLLGVRHQITKVKTDVESEALGTCYEITDRIFLYENLRFDVGEEKNSKEFAKKIASLGDVFVQDAFANMHREHASMVVVAEFLPYYAGMLVEKEINSLFKLMNAPDKPLICLIGGAKIEDKLPIILSLSKIADAVLVGGKAANEWISEGYKKVNNVFLPNDGLNQNGSIVKMERDLIQKGIFDIGPETIMLYKSVLSSAKTIFWNGNMGLSEQKRFAHGTNELARFISRLKADKIVSGGNTVEAIDELKLSNDFTFISTGGGATSDFICGKKLAAVELLLK